MKFLLLGPFEVRDGETPLPLPRKKHRALLALLMLRAGEVVSADTLVEELWGERHRKQRWPRSATTGPSCARSSGPT